MRTLSPVSCHRWDGPHEGSAAHRLLAIFAAGVLVLAFGGPASAAPSTAVTCGSTITAPGEYFLAGDCAGAGITITASDVHLMLEGHIMTGAALDVGITATGVSNVHIEGPGTITNYSFGVALSSVSQSLVEEVTATANLEDGFNQFQGSDNRYDRLTAADDQRGIVLEATSNNDVLRSTTNGNSVGINLVNVGRGNKIVANEASGNGNAGISVGPVSPGADRNQFHGNTALGNVGFDLLDLNVGCDGNNWAGNRFESANQSCIS